jgi:hypothetical protein
MHALAQIVLEHPSSNWTGYHDAIELALRVRESSPEKTALIEVVVRRTVEESGFSEKAGYVLETLRRVLKEEL